MSRVLSKIDAHAKARLLHEIARKNGDKNAKDNSSIMKFWSGF